MPDIRPSSGAYRATFPRRGKAFLRRGGARPARDKTAARNLRVIRRGGIYAARCNHTDIATQRTNGTGRIVASPTNLPEMDALPITAYLPVACREGS